MKGNFSNMLGLLVAAFLLFQIATADNAGGRDYGAYADVFTGLDACVADSLSDAFAGGLGNC